MKLTTLEDLICPACLSQHHTESSLSVSSFIPARMVGDGDKTEVLEAILLCNTCAKEYPVIAGVLIAVPDVASYIRKQFGSIVSNCTLSGSISSHLIEYLLNKGYNLAKVEAREYYDAPRKLSTYICNHYDDLTQLASSKNSLGRYLRSNYHDFYATVLKLWEQTAPSTLERKRALDVGSYVGGVTNRFADTFERIYGVDDSFAGTLIARRIQIGYPTQLVEYDLYLEGDRKQQRELAIPLRENTDFLVASALSLPFRPALFDLTMNFNLLELVSSPTLMVQELRRVSKAAADIILTSPYWWEEDETHTNEWLGGQKDCTTIDALKALFEQLGVSLVVEQAEVPWILRYNSRAFMSFISSVMIGRVAR